MNLRLAFAVNNNNQFEKKHFIPVIISMESPDEVIQILTRYIHWINDEWKQNKSNFKLFTIKAGILKSSVSK